MVSSTVAIGLGYPSNIMLMAKAAMAAPIACRMYSVMVPPPSAVLESASNTAGLCA